MKLASAIRVLIVDDSALVRQILTRALGDDPHIEVVGTARNGVEALEKCSRLNPDVITLDIEMPELDGIEVLRRLDRHCGARVVVLSSVDDPATTYEALALGAVEFVVKPVAGVVSSIDDLSTRLRAKIRTAYAVAPRQAAAAMRVAPRFMARTDAPAAQWPPARTAPDRVPRVCVAIAASTGGPPALEIMFSALPRALPASYVVVQHLPSGFSASLGRRLSTAGEVPFREAEPRMALEAGCGYVAPFGLHLAVVTDSRGVRRFEMRDDVPMHSVRPAADPLFDSVAAEFGRMSVAVVLTGMGTDGARGASHIRNAGGRVIVQDETTSVVWGMPRAASANAAPEDVLPLDLIGERVSQYVADFAAGEAI